MKLEEYLKEKNLLHNLHKTQDGKLYYDSYLDLEGIAITTLPDNLIVRGRRFLRDTKVGGKIYKGF